MILDKLRISKKSALHCMVYILTYLLLLSILSISYKIGNQVVNLLGNLLVNQIVNLLDNHLYNLQSPHLFQAPSCSLHAAGGNENCTTCVPGYRDDHYVTECTSCPVGTFNTIEGSTVCYTCEFPTYAVDEGSTKCAQFYLQTTSVQLAFTTSLFVLILISCWLAAGERSVVLAANMLLPIVDLISDVLYVQSAVFYSVDYFYIALATLLLPSCVFLTDVVAKRAYPIPQSPFSRISSVCS